MTQNKNFKKIVRDRMKKTGESYTAARAALLASRTLKPRDPAPGVEAREHEDPPVQDA